MKQKATVIKTEENRALVLVPRASACGDKCASCAGCSSKANHKAWVLNEIGATPGDLVVLSVADSALLLSAFLLYMMPLFVFLAAYLVCFSYTENALYSAILSALSLVISFFILHKLDQKIAPKTYITEIIKKENSDGI